MTCCLAARGQAYCAKTLIQIRRTAVTEISTLNAMRNAPSEILSTSSLPIQVPTKLTATAAAIVSRYGR